MWSEISAMIMLKLSQYWKKLTNYYTFCYMHFQALNYLPNLEECYAAGNRIKTIELSRCKKLQDIDVSKNRITDLSGIKSLPNLQVSVGVSPLCLLYKNTWNCSKFYVYSFQKTVCQSILILFQTLNISSNQIASLKPLGKSK